MSADLSSAPRSESATPLVKCANCGTREGTLRWGDALALTHGGGAMWCEVCAITVQLRHARERAARIPEMEARLAFLRGAESPPDSERTS